MFVNLSNPMVYIIGFQMAVLLVPAFAALFHELREEREARGSALPFGAARAGEIVEPSSISSAA